MKKNKVCDDPFFMSLEKKKKIMNLNKISNTDVELIEESLSVEILKATYVWSIINFFNNDPVGIKKRQESEIFSAKHNDEVKWKLELYSDGHNDKYLSLSLHLVSSNVPEMQVFYKCSILNQYNQKINTKTGMFYANVEKETTAGFPKFMNTSLFDESNNHAFKRFTILCRIYSFVQDISVPKSENQLIGDLESLMEDAKLTDVTLIASGKELKAHKAILAVRSPVFAKMFDHDMQEKQENVVRISDVDPAVLEEVLRFMYTGKLKNVDNNTQDILIAADKYQLEELKNICKEALIKNLKVSNAINTLVLADRHNVNELKDKVIDFINKHAKKVVDTPAFKSLNKAQAYLIMEAYCVMATALKDRSASRNASKKRRRKKKVKF